MPASLCCFNLSQAAVCRLAAKEPPLGQQHARPDTYSFAGPSLPRCRSLRLCSWCVCVCACVRVFVCGWVGGWVGGPEGRVGRCLGVWVAGRLAGWVSGGWVLFVCVLLSCWLLSVSFDLPL